MHVLVENYLIFHTANRYCRFPDGLCKPPLPVGRRGVHGNDRLRSTLAIARLPGFKELHENEYFTKK